MAEWRHNYPDAKSAAKDIPIPGPFLHGDSFREAGRHSADSRASLEASPEQAAVGPSPASFGEGFRAAVRPLAFQGWLKLPILKHHDFLYSIL